MYAQKWRDNTISKAGQIRHKTNLERAASDNANLRGAVLKLREAMLVFAKGESWVARQTPARGFWPYRVPSRFEIIWVGDGNPQELVLKVMREVFGEEKKA